MRIKRYAESRLAEDWGRHKVGALVVKTSKINHKTKGECYIPLPNPVFAYLAVAEEMGEAAKEVEKTLLKNAKEGTSKATGDKSTYFRPTDFDEYFQVVSVLVITSFLVIEAYCNQAIPEDFIWHENKRRFPFFPKKKLSKRKIERGFSTTEKITKILPVVFKKDNPKGIALWGDYKKLLKIRNDLVHLKSPFREKEGETYGKNYEELCEEVLNADVDQIVKTPRDIITYFNEQYFDDPDENVRTTL
ncbi:MAG: hypothetical protein KAS04_02215 [Candidatus Aenigmarchaeota archaeon]|nr:hypothetical protein [Candidatus Aenigmarchaeota archaeon]